MVINPMKKIYQLVLAVLALTSCESNKLDPEVVKTMVTIHAIDNTGLQSSLFTQLNVNGQTMNVSRIPLLSNYDMMSCEIFQYTDDKYGLEFTLTDKGRISFQQVAVSYKGRHGVLAIGKQFKCFIKFGSQVGGYKIRIATPLTKEEAEEISKNVTRNYIAIKEKT